MKAISWLLISVLLALGLYLLTGCQALSSAGVSVETKYGRVSYELPRGYSK